MKPALLVILTILPCLAMAQSSTDSTPPAQSSDTDQKHHHRMSPDQEVAFLTTRLGLNATQQGQIKAVLVTRKEQMKAIHTNTGLTEEQKKEQKKALFASTRQQIEQYLTPTQITQFEQLHRHHA